MVNEATCKLSKSMIQNEPWHFLFSAVRVFLWNECPFSQVKLVQQYREIMKSLCLCILYKQKFNKNFSCIEGPSLITLQDFRFQIYITYHMMKGVVLYFVLLSLALVAMTTRGDCDSEVQCARKSRDRLLLCHSSCNTLPRSRLTCLKTCYLDAYGKIKDCIEEERKTK